eukprot:TRINITY_DN17165_c0_g1_i1.p1 TRINITY_DN17165_c0_g1~~TRINITY_DN17165_c0_g1_i1.p1  ORF type:complete len:594 (+),score=87.58 TRINITY_DN17165_c0_g1_i1:162-1943(+)
MSLQASIQSVSSQHRPSTPTPHRQQRVKRIPPDLLLEFDLGRTAEPFRSSQDSPASVFTLLIFILSLVVLVFGGLYFQANSPPTSLGRGQTPFGYSFNNTASVYKTMSSQQQTMLWVVSAGLATVATAMAGYLIYKHLRNWTAPQEQKWIVRILIMVPIFCVDSWFSIRFPGLGIYFDLFRDSYEAYCLYSFLRLLMAFLGGELELEILLEKKDPISHPFPMCCLQKIPLGRKFLWRCKQCILQFVLFKPILAVSTFLCEHYGVYKDGDLSLNTGYFWLTLLDNISITIAMYALVLFYYATAAELQPYRPILKFWCVKLVVFFEFWQEVIIAILIYEGVIGSVGSWNSTLVSYALNNFIVLLEMVVIAILHGFAFSHSTYKDPSKQRLLSDVSGGLKPVVRNFKEVLSMRDTYHDTVATFSRNELMSPGVKVRSGEQRIVEKVEIDFDAGSDEQETLIGGGNKTIGHTRKHHHITAITIDDDNDQIQVSDGGKHGSSDEENSPGDGKRKRKTSLSEKERNRRRKSGHKRLSQTVTTEDDKEHLWVLMDDGSSPESGVSVASVSSTSSFGSYGSAQKMERQSRRDDDQETDSLL